MHVSLHEAQAASQPGGCGHVSSWLFALCLAARSYPSIRSDLGHILQASLTHTKGSCGIQTKLTDHWLVLCHAAYIISMSFCSAFLVCMYCNSRFDTDECMFAAQQLTQHASGSIQHSFDCRSACCCSSSVSSQGSYQSHISGIQLGIACIEAEQFQADTHA